MSDNKDLSFFLQSKINEKIYYVTDPDISVSSISSGNSCDEEIDLQHYDSTDNVQYIFLQKFSDRSDK